MFIELKRRCFRRVENCQVPAENFDTARRFVEILRTRRTGSDQALNFYHVFTAHLFSARKTFRSVGVNHYLGYAVTVTHIEKNHSAVVSTAMYPAAKYDCLVNVVYVKS